MVKRLFLISSLVILLAPTTNYCFNLKIGSFEFDTDIISGNKDAVLFVATTTCMAAAFFLYHYTTRFNVNDAYNLKASITNYLHTTSKYYDQELQLLNTPLNTATIKSNLQDIAVTTDSNTPYVTYVIILKNNLEKCRHYENKIEMNLPKMKKAYASLDPFNTQEIMHYQTLIEDLKRLYTKLHKLGNSLKKLIGYSIQSKGYRHEQMVQTLHALGCQNFAHNEKQCSTAIYL